MFTLAEVIEVLVGYVLLKGVLPLILLALFSLGRKEKKRRDE